MAQLENMETTTKQIEAASSVTGKMMMYPTTAEEAEKLADRLNTRTIEVVQELMGESLVVRPDGAVLIEWGAPAPPGAESVIEELSTHLAEVDYSSCYEGL